MKRVIDGVLYATDKATLLAVVDDGNPGDFGYFEEGLYLTEKGRFFLAGSGGDGIEPISRQQALAWCERWDKVSVIEEHFSDMVADA